MQLWTWAVLDLGGPGTGPRYEYENTMSRKILAANRRARHEYHIEEKLEAGIALAGTEVKSIREGRVQLRDAYVEVRDGEAWLVGVHISPYSHGTYANHDPERRRKLLLHKREIAKLEEVVMRKGLTVVPLAMYLKGHLVKVEIAVVRGKKLHDKRLAAKKRIMDREAEEAMSRGR